MKIAEKSLRVLVACEESQAVTKAFRELGHQAYSCDLKPCSGPFPEYHFQQSVFDVIEQGWDLMIGHPPCTYLTITGNRWMKPEYAERFPTRIQDREDAAAFFMALANAPIEKICLENPVGIMSSRWRKADQIIQPYFFGDSAMKLTALWLKNLPKLQHFRHRDLFVDEPTHVHKGEQVVFKSGKKMAKWYADAASLSSHDRAELRSKTFPGIARAMASQWGGLVK